MPASWHEGLDSSFLDFVPASDDRFKFLFVVGFIGDLIFQSHSRLNTGMN